MRQTLAIFLDAYRELNARRLFWITLIISAVLVLVFAMVGLTDRGIKILFWEIPSPLNTSLMPPEMFYKLVFLNLGVKFWLGGLAMILALVTTAGLIPEFIGSGSIELSLSKPIGRARLFLTKYLSGLLFVALQVGVFTATAFLLIGLRGKAWEPGLFLAVPIVLLLFSYLYCICALLGLLTRSTIASLLLTLLIWAGIFGLHSTEQIFLWMREGTALTVETAQRDIQRLEERQAPRAGEADPPPPSERLERLRTMLPDFERSATRWRRWHALVLGLKTVVPKTTETTEVLRRTLISAAELDDLGPDNDTSPAPPFFGRGEVRISQREQQRRMVEALDRRSVAWVIGTSLAFEAVVLGIATLIFVRRDF